jgi:hypothetical protein
MASTSSVNTASNAANISALVGGAGVAGMGLAASGGTTAGTIGTMATMNAEQDAMAMASMKFQALAAQRAMIMQCLRDLIKDAKDCVKDQGEAGHKP